jgi:membrane protein YdbS with pleckstrin-like domain
MGFPKRLLADHEKMVLDIRPHWVALAGPVVLTVAIIVAEILAYVYIPDDWPSWTRGAALGIGVALFLFVAVRAFLAWVTSHFVVTSDRLIHRSGWLAKQSMEIPLERINDVSFHQTVLERLVGAGDLVIESGGEFGQNFFRDIRKPEEVQKTIYEMSEENQNRMMRPAGDAAEDDDESPLDQIEQLERMKEKGTISEEEFETQKRRLLGRL